MELIRAQVGCFRRLTIRGHNGNMYPFSVQHPSHRQSRREERITQLMRILNRYIVGRYLVILPMWMILIASLLLSSSVSSVLERKKESRKRNLMFHLPTMIPLAPQARLVEDDPSYLSMYEMYEDHCNRSGIHKDDYIVFFLNRMRDVMVSEDISKRTKVDVLNLKTEIMEEISNRMIPDHILSNVKEKGEKVLMLIIYLSVLSCIVHVTCCQIFC